MGKPVVVKILGDAASLTRSIEISQSAIGRLGGAAKAAATGLALAATGIGISVTRSALSFEEDMASVFTLLPGITEEAMSQMDDQVLDFSKQLGIVPGEVVPALYDALSAGVPQDNVFEFMEVAGKAAIGGNLEVADAVDLLSTAVNAYAESGLTASEASDLFFTTVRLGKTTVPELQGAFSQVGPVAAALGVSLDEVGASLAVLTASGVPTKGAATQIRSAIAELGKSGTVAAKAFESINNQTFPEFIAQGGSFEDALMSMAGSGGSLIDMFGSIEAAQGVMALTADEGSALSSAMLEMTDSAGATEGAFDTMDETTARSLDKLKANLGAVSVELGEKVLPVLATFTDYLVDNWPAIEAAVKPVLGQFETWAVDIMPHLREAMETVVAWVAENWPEIQATLQAVMEVIVEDIVPAIQTAFEVIIEVAGAVVDWIRDHWPQISEILETVRDTIANVIIPAIIGAFTWLKDTATTIFNNLKAFWEEWGGAITEAFSTAWEGIKLIFDGVFTALTGIWDFWSAAFENDWDGVWEAIKQIFKGAWDSLTGIFLTAWAGFKLIYTVIWDSMKTKFSDIMDGLVDYIKGLPGRFTDVITAGKDALIGVGADLMNWIGDGIKSAVVDVGQAIWDNLPGPVKWALEHGASGIDSIFGGGEGKVLGSAIDGAAAAAAREAELLEASTFGRANGGPASGAVLVGERGPELLRIPNSMGGASVIANQDMASAGGGVTINVGGSTSTAKEIGDEVMFQLRRAG